jgi:hypothetical protein
MATSVADAETSHNTSQSTLISAAKSTADAAGSGGATWTETEIDFGTSPKYDATFTITDATVSGTSKVIVVPCGKAATGRVGDDWAWDGLTLAASPNSGNFTLYVCALPGPVAGKRKIQYTVS